MMRMEAALPPRLAAWLLSHSASGPRAESILGDLLEEFSDLSARSGLATARRWFWRQTWKSAAYLSAAELRTRAPWSLAIAIVLGFLLCRYTLTVPEFVVIGFLRTQTPYSNRRYDFYVWLVTWGIPIVRFVDFLLIGFIVAVLAKGREILAIIAAGIATTMIIGAQILALIGLLPSNQLALAVAPNVQDWIALLLGGLVVQTMRSISSRKLSTLS